MLESMRALTIALTLAALAAWAHADNPSLEPRQQNVVVQHKAIGDKPIIGPRFAPVTVDFFIRLEDTYYIKNIYRRLKQLAKRHPTRMRIVFRPMPQSQYSYWYYAEAALEAYAQDKFFEFVEAVYRQRRRPNRKQLSDVARSIGIDVDRFEKALETRRHKAEWRPTTTTTCSGSTCARRRSRCCSTASRRSTRAIDHGIAIATAIAPVTRTTGTPAT